uniref:Uncharacterized protein n=1 Tax=Graphocephala atropunctata TaxID=36148 RepID=A0A1B6KMZ9_9HEMI
MPQYHDRDGCTDYRRECRTTQNVYECPPPPPVKPPVLNCEPINVSQKKKYKYTANEKGEGSGDNLSGWMHDEYLSLAKELSDLRQLTCEKTGEDDPDNRDLLQARNYVLDRLAEMLAKREEIERRMKQKKQKNQN